MRKDFKFQFSIAGQAGAMLKPQSLSIEWAPSKWSPQQVEPKLGCMSDLLAGLNALQLASLIEPQLIKERSLESVATYCDGLDINAHLDTKFQLPKDSFTPVDNDLNASLDKWIPLLFSANENKLTFHFQFVELFLDIMNRHEDKSGKDLLFTDSVSLEPQLRQKLQTLFSLFFYTRAIIVAQYNKHLRDVAYDSVRVDRITNYLAHPDYTVNDAILWHKINALLPNDGRAESIFTSWAHNGYLLEKAVPHSWFKSKGSDELQDALHHWQIQWLLGSTSGLLYRLREEAYGLIEGYQNIFYPDAATWEKNTNSQMHFSVSANRELFRKNSVRAA